MHDPLAERHGTLIAEGWRVIIAARDAARRDDPPLGQLPRLEALRQRIVEAHAQELTRNEMSTAHVDDWFAELETVLSNAIAHFRVQALPLPQHITPPLTAPPPVHPADAPALNMARA